MNNNDNSQPLYTLNGIEDLANNLNVPATEVLRELENLRAANARYVHENATLQTQIEAQTFALNNDTTGLRTISATLQGLANAQNEARSFQYDFLRNQAATHDRMQAVLDQLGTRESKSMPTPITPRFSGSAGPVSFTEIKAKVESQRVRYPAALSSDKALIAYMFQCLEGPPSRYVSMLMSHEIPDTLGVLQNYKLFLSTLNNLFGDQFSREEIVHKLMHIRQANTTFYEYLLRFQELASRTKWDSEALLDRFKDGLSKELKDALAIGWHKLTTMEEVISAASLAFQNLKTRDNLRHRFNSFTQNQQPPRRQQTGTTAGPSPMDIDAISIKKLTPEEHQRRKINNLCLYCAGSNHVVRNCPVKKPIQANVVNLEDPENSMAEF